MLSVPFKWLFDRLLTQSCTRPIIVSINYLKSHLSNALILFTDGGLTVNGLCWHLESLFIGMKYSCKVFVIVFPPHHETLLLMTLCLGCLCKPVPLYMCTINIFPSLNICNNPIYSHMNTGPPSYYCNANLQTAYLIANTLSQLCLFYGSGVSLKWLPLFWSD